MGITVDYSSLTQSRIDRLRNLDQALANDQQPQSSFQGLYREDREKIQRVLKAYGFSDFTNVDLQKSGGYAAIRVELTRLRAELQDQIDGVISKARVKKVFPSIPSQVLSHSIGRFLTPEDIIASKNTSKQPKVATPARSIIRAYNLEPLIQNYLHLSCKELNENQLLFVIKQLRSMATELSKLEELPPPSYQSMASFFELVEAINLHRLMNLLNQIHPHPDLGKEISNLQLPKDPEEIVEEARRLRNWMEHNGAFLEKFTKLSLNQYGFSLISKEIGKLKNLKELSLSHNHIIAIPSELGNLKALEKLDLSENLITELPTELGNLTNLVQLRLEFNRISYVPFDTLAQLTQLRLLLLQDNPLLNEKDAKLLFGVILRL